MSTNNNFIHTDRCGVTAIGSSVVRVVPDSASIVAAVSRSDKEPKEAFASARTAAGEVQAFLREQGIRSFFSSRITLTQEFRPGQGNAPGPVMGYKARIGFNIKLNDLDRMEELVSGLIAAGANELAGITYQTSLLQESRNDARRQAIAAAREKAELYCQEAGVSVGKVLAINEIGASPSKPPPPPAVNLADPAEITVVSNIEMTFEIDRSALD